MREKALVTSGSYSEHGGGDLGVSQICFKDHLSSHTENPSRTWPKLGVQGHSKAARQTELPGSAAAKRSKVHRATCGLYFQGAGWP